MRRKRPRNWWILPTFLLCLFFSATSAAHRKRQNFFSLGAHLDADGLARRLRLLANDLLAIPDVQAAVDSLPFENDYLDSHLVQQMKEDVDEGISRYKGALQRAASMIVEISSEERPRVEKAVPKCDRLASSIARGEAIHNTSCELPLFAEKAPSIGGFAGDSIQKAFKSLSTEPGVVTEYLVDGSSESQHEFPAKPILPSRALHWREYGAALALSRSLPVRNVILLDNVLSREESTEYASALISTAQSIFAVTSSETDLNLIMGTSLSCPASLSYPSDKVGFQDANRFFQNIRLLPRRAEWGDLLGEVDSFLNVDVNTTCAINVITHSNLGLSGHHFDFLASICSSLSVVLLSPSDSLAEIDRVRCKRNISYLCTVLPMKDVGSVVRLGDVVSLLPTEEEDNRDKAKVAVTLPTATPDTTVGFSVIVRSTGSSYSFPMSPSIPTVLGMDISISVLLDSLLHSPLIHRAPQTAAVALFLINDAGVVLASSRVESTGLPLWFAEAWQTDESSRLWRTLRDDHQVVVEASVGANSQNAVQSFIYTSDKLTAVSAWIVLRSLSGALPVRVARLASTNRQTHSFRDIVYHRIDLQRDSSLPFCSHWGGVSLAGKAALFLPSSAYERTATASLSHSTPFDDDSFAGESAADASNTWLFLSDQIGLIRSSSIRRGIQEEAAALASIAEKWINSKSNEWVAGHVIRRYGSSMRGVTITVPATVLRRDFEPPRQPWFSLALSHPGRLIFSGPYSDQRLGDIVTISTVVFEGIAGSMHDASSDQIFGVIAMDVPAHLLHKLLTDAIPECQQNRRCVLLSESGDVLSSSDSAPSGLNSEAIERFHVAHLDPALAAQLLHNEQLLRKQECLDKSGAVNRFFTLNTTQSRVFSMPCSSASEWPSSSESESEETKDSSASLSVPPPLFAEALLVPMTNMLLALVNSSCARKATIAAFCPCSVSDRRCLLCSRFDPSECECPCRCSSSQSPTSSSLSECKDSEGENAASVHNRLPLCPYTLRQSHFVSTPPLPPQLAECFPLHCSLYRSESSCLGRPGCSWCRLSEDFPNSFSLLSSPFCAHTHSCYRGVVGSRPRKWPPAWPQSSQLPSGPFSDASSPSRPSSFLFGPFLAILLIVALVALFAFGCYKSQNPGLRPERSAGSLGPLLLLSPQNGDFCFDHDGSMDKPALISFENEASLAVAAPVRRVAGAPTMASLSDHGYSTMAATTTAGEESECTASVFAESEGDVASSIRRVPPLDFRLSHPLPPLGFSKARLTRLPPPPLPGNTLLPSPRTLIITAADVHRVDPEAVSY